MGETLMQRRSVRDDGLRVVNRFQQEQYVTNQVPTRSNVLLMRSESAPPCWSTPMTRPAASTWQ